MLCGPDDIDRIARIVSAPEVWDNIRDDGSSDGDRERLAEVFLSVPEILTLSPNENTAFFLVPHNSFSYEVHTCVTKDGRGKAASDAAREALEYVFGKTPVLKLLSWTPEFNKPALLFALRAGFEIEGRMKKSFLKNGTLHDETLVGLTKERWLCLR